MKLPKNKITLFFLIVFALLAIWLVLFLAMKLININKDKCQEDADCTKMSVFSCFESCGQQIPINKRYETSKNIETLIKCIPTLPLQVLFFNNMVSCRSKFLPTKAVCNENNRCEIVTNCESVCEMTKQNVEVYSYLMQELDNPSHSYNHHTIRSLSILRTSNCECEYDFCTKVNNVCRTLPENKRQEREYCLSMLLALECEETLPS